ncbi:hypothetical protein NUSPORA_01884, partial [Nucleospora cyclopteri]
MYLKYIVKLGNIFCSDINLSSNQLNFESFLADDIFELNQQVIYDFKDPFNFRNYICHIDKIIEKIFDDKMFDINKEKWKIAKIKLKNIKSKDIHKFFTKKRSLIRSKNVKNFYASLEIDFLIFAYLKFINVLENLNTKNMHITKMQNDCEQIDIFLNFIYQSKYNFEFKIKNRLLLDKTIIVVCNHIIVLLKDKQHIINEKIKMQIYTFEILNKTFSELYKQYETNFANQIFPLFENYQVLEHNNVNNKRYLTIENALVEKENLLKQKIDVYSEDFDSSIIYTIDRIHNLTTWMIQEMNYEPSTKYFLDIFVYYNYLKHLVYLKNHYLQTFINETNVKKAIIDDFQHKISICWKIEFVFENLTRELIFLIESMIKKHKGFDFENMINLVFQKTNYINNSEVNNFIENLSIDDFFIIIYESDYMLCN